MELVFVYGTLRNGCGNHSLLADSTFVGDFLLSSSNFKMVNLGAFPGVVKVPFGDGTAVHGEVYEVDKYTMAYLDRLEGHPSFYCREKAKVMNLEGTREAWIYLLPNSYASLPIIESGNWLDT